MHYVATRRCLLGAGSAPSFFLGSLNSIYGDGSDGSVTISTAVTLTRDQYYENLTITETGSIDVAGFRIFVRNLLIMKSGSEIKKNGNDGTVTAGGLGHPARTVGGSASGGAGGDIDLGSNGTAGAGLTQGLGGNGGAGGATGGGAGGTSSFAAITTGLRYPASWPLSVKGSISIGNAFWTGGCGGGGGAALITLAGGGGGGAGVILICARSIDARLNSKLSTRGGNGANSPVGGGGGGGGGGGVIVVFTAGKLSNIKWTVDVAGGIGGTGSAGNGSNGSSGQYYIVAGEQ